MRIAAAHGNFAEAELTVQRGDLSDPVLELWDGLDGVLLAVRLEPILAALVGAGVIIGINRRRLEELALYLAEEE